MNQTTPTPENQAVIRYEFPAKRPVVTYTILAITALFFVAQQLSILVLDIDLLSVALAKSNDMIYAGQVWRLITPVLMHANFVHIGFNMYALFIIGQRLERVYGHHRFLILYLLSAIAGNLFSFYLTPYPSIGASTAIFGLLAADGIYIYNNRRFFPQAQRVLVNLAVILVVNILYGFTIPNIDIWGHLGGFLGGFGFSWFAGPLITFKRTEEEILLADTHSGKTTLKIGSIELVVLGLLSAFRILIHP